jgi:hypothetical protein
MPARHPVARDDHIIEILAGFVKRTPFPHRLR